MKCCACIRAKSSAIPITEDGSCIVAEILRTHLSWVNPKVGDSVCTDCWTQVYTFHQFYMDIKVNHETLMAAKDSVRKEATAPNTTAAGDLGEVKIKIENVWHVNNEEPINPIDNTEQENVFCEPLKDACNPTEETDNIAVSPSGFKIEENSSEDDEDSRSDSSYCPDSDTLKELAEVECEIEILPQKEQRKRQRPAVDRLAKDTQSTKRRARSPKDNNESNEDDDDELIRKYIAMACDLCQYVGADFLAMKTHFKEMHTSLQPYIKCCGRKLNKRFKIVQHAYKHKDPEHFKCKECNKIFADNSILRTHRLSVHAPKDQLKFGCDLCPKRFSRQTLLEIHKPTHIPIEERKYYCELCPATKPFASEHMLNIHISKRHKRDANVCHVCAKEIRDKQAFEKHVRLHFENSGPRIKCPRPDCDSWLKDEDNLKHHLRRHNDGGQTFICSECDRHCKNRRALRSHIKYAHTNEIFSCEECQKTFKKAISLREHMARHTGEPLYKCPFCTRTFNSNANMHSHKKRLHPEQWDHWRKTKQESSQKIISSSAATARAMSFTAPSE